MTWLRQRMIEDMQVRNLARETQVSYLRQVSQFARPSYKFAAQEDAASAIRLLHQLRQLANSLHAKHVDLSADAPRPAPEIRIAPRV